MKKTNEKKKVRDKKTDGITLVALVITILFSYDYDRKYSYSNKFLLI